MEQETQQAIANTSNATIIDAIYDIICFERGSACFDYHAIITRINRLATLHAQLD